jgi:hypothetical protein
MTHSNNAADSWHPCFLFPVETSYVDPSQPSQLTIILQLMTHAKESKVPHSQLDQQRRRMSDKSDNISNMINKSGKFVWTIMALYTFATATQGSHLEDARIYFTKIGETSYLTDLVSIKVRVNIADAVGVLRKLKQAAKHQHLAVTRRGPKELYRAQNDAFWELSRHRLARADLLLVRVETLNNLQSPYFSAKRQGRKKQSILALIIVIGLIATTLGGVYTYHELTHISEEASKNEHALHVCHFQFYSAIYLIGRISYLDRFSVPFQKIRCRMKNIVPKKVQNGTHLCHLAILVYTHSMCFLTKKVWHKDGNQKLIPYGFHEKTLSKRSSGSSSKISF